MESAESGISGSSRKVPEGLMTAVRSCMRCSRGSASTRHVATSDGNMHACGYGYREQCADVSKRRQTSPSKARGGCMHTGGWQCTHKL